MTRYLLLLCLLLPGAGSLLAQPGARVFVLNSLGENISVVNLTDQTVQLNALAAGLYPNEIRRGGDSLLVVNSGVNQVQIVDKNAITNINSIDFGSGTNPWSVATTGDGRALVTLLFTNQVAVVDLATGSITQTLTVGTAPEGLVVHGGFAYVCNSGFTLNGYEPGTLSKIDLNTLAISEIRVGINPQSVAVAGNQLLVACTGNYADVGGRLDIVDIAAAAVVDSIEAGTAITQVSAGEGRAYLATFGSGILVYDLTAGTFIYDAANPLPGGPGMASDRDGRLYLADFGSDSLYIYDRNLNRESAWAVGNGPVSLVVDLDNFVGLGNLPEQPLSFALLPNYPNPFNPETRLEYRLEEGGEVLLEVLNVLGQRVAVPDAGLRSPGTYRIRWDARNSRGEALVSGHYFYRLSVNGRSVVRRMTLVR